MGWEGEKLKREQNRAKHPFSLNKITRHPVNTKPFNELPRSMVTTQGHAGQNGRLPGTSCAEKSSKVQYPVCSHQRYFLATADLQVSFEVLKTPDPLWHTLHFGGVFTIELRDHIQLLVKTWYQSFKHLFSSPSVLSPKNNLEARAKLGFLWWWAPGKGDLRHWASFLREARSWLRAQVFADQRREKPKLEARAEYMLHLVKQKGASPVCPEKPSFLKSGCTSSKIISQREAMSFPYPQPWLPASIVSRNARLCVWTPKSPHINPG